MMAVLGFPRPPLLCSQGEKLCEIPLALTPLKKFTNLRVIFGIREIPKLYRIMWEKKVYPPTCGEDKKYTHLPYMWREFTYAGYFL